MKTETELSNSEHLIICECGKTALECKEASQAIEHLINIGKIEIKKEWLEFLKDIRESGWDINKVEKKMDDLRNAIKEQRW